MNTDDMARTACLDALDARILLALDDDPNASALQVAKSLGVSRNTVHAHLQRMERNGVLGGFSRRLSPATLGRPVMAFMSLAISQHDEHRLLSQLAHIPEVMEVHFTTGDADLFVRVAVRDTTDLHRVTNAILAIPGVVRSSTRISLGTSMHYRTRPMLEQLAATR